MTCIADEILVSGEISTQADVSQGLAVLIVILYTTGWLGPGASRPQMSAKREPRNRPNRGVARNTRLGALRAGRPRSQTTP